MPSTGWFTITVPVACIAILANTAAAAMLLHSTHTIVDCQQITALATVPSTPSGTLLLIGLDDGTIAMRDFPGFSLAFELSYSVSTTLHKFRSGAFVEMARLYCDCRVSTALQRTGNSVECCVVLLPQ